MTKILYLLKSQAFVGMPPELSYEDNDGDGMCDYDGCSIGRGKNRVNYPADPDCSSAGDDNEATECVPSAWCRQ